MTNKQEKIRRYDSVEEEKNKENTVFTFSISTIGSR